MNNQEIVPHTGKHFGKSCMVTADIHEVCASVPDAEDKTINPQNWMREILLFLLWTQGNGNWLKFTSCL